MNIHQTPDQRITQLEAENLGLENKLSDAESLIEDLKNEMADLENEIKDIADFNDDEIRSEFLSRSMVDPMDAEYLRLAEHIAAGEADEALSLLANISGGVVSPAVVKMLAKARTQGSLL